MAGRGGERPLIIKRVTVEAHAGHHGGAWKVAYADFVTAMMAFFLLLWLISSASEDTLKGLADYFNDAKLNDGRPGGQDGFLSGRTIMPNVATPPSVTILEPPIPFQSGSPEAEEAELLAAQLGITGAISDAAFEQERARREQALFDSTKEAITATLAHTPELSRFAENLLIEQTPEGLRIQIVDRENAPMFPIGSDQMYPHTRKLLAVVAQAVADLPHRLSIRGHTDSLPFAPGLHYDNWRLSSDRANATRRALIELGLDTARVADVTGKGDGEPLARDNPADPRNRRLSLVLLHEPGTGVGPPSTAGP
jgi:chemotaxis protein MotB